MAPVAKSSTESREKMANKAWGSTSCSELAVLVVAASEVQVFGGVGAWLRNFIILFVVLFD
jgi:hypothetical protein